MLLNSVNFILIDLILAGKTLTIIVRQNTELGVEAGLAEESLNLVLVLGLMNHPNNHPFNHYSLTKSHWLPNACHSRPHLIRQYLKYVKTLLHRRIDSKHGNK